VPSGILPKSDRFTVVAAFMSVIVIADKTAKPASVGLIRFSPGSESNKV
jgi:hypothetical protein